MQRWLGITFSPSSRSQKIHVFERNLTASALYSKGFVESRGAASLLYYAGLDEENEYIPSCTQSTTLFQAGQETHRMGLTAAVYI